MEFCTFVKYEGKACTGFFLAMGAYGALGEEVRSLLLAVVQGSYNHINMAECGLATYLWEERGAIMEWATTDFKVGEREKHGSMRELALTAAWLRSLGGVWPSDG